MIDMESRVGRRIIGRIETGRPLEESLIAVCRKYGVEACEVRVTGILRDPILLAYKEEDAEYTAAYRVGGLATLVSFTGDISLLGSELLVNAKAVVAWDDRGLPRVIAGHLKSAEVHSVEYVIDAFDDVVLERGFDPITRLPLWTSISRKELMRETPEGAVAPEPHPGRSAPQPSAGAAGSTNQRKLTPEPKKRPPVQPPPVAGKLPLPRTVSALAPLTLLTEQPARIVAAMSDDLDGGPELRPALNERDVEVVRRPPRKGSWAEAITRSRELEEEEDGEEQDDIDPMPGDVVNHPKFGRCVVLGTDEDERVMIRRPGGGKAALARSHMKLHRTGTTDEGKAIFRMVVTRPL
ncbi:MAG: hypothetical protein FJ125_11205 [Deltaproteobacteria bacterium]|nr:hypothetical protein [Deltaproteobacteria bacterium]